MRWGATRSASFYPVFKPGTLAAAAVLESLSWLSGIRPPAQQGMILAIMLGVVFTFATVWVLWAMVLGAVLKIARSSGSHQRPD